MYGGPVTETNTNKLIELADVDGFMIGSTSTKPIFRTIFDMVNTYVDSQWREKRWGVLASVSMCSLLESKVEHKLNYNDKRQVAIEWEISITTNFW